jgi:putative glycosyltransferase (TIGR04348 family)
MKIALITPASAQSRSGNRNTAVRWARFMRAAGHRVSIATVWDGADADVMIALHARRSHESIARFAARHPRRPLIVALTGTDLYRDIRTDHNAQESLRLASQLIVLQDQGTRELAPALRRKTRVIYQSVTPVAPQAPITRWFEICVAGHLRGEKDPFRAAAALHYLPPQSTARVIHLGRALDTAMADEARQWMTLEPRYTWLGERPHWQTLRRLAHARIMVISSRMEGGANVVGEALAAGVPIIASRIPGNVGMLGGDYAGYFPVTNERALARLLWRAESDAEYYRLLKKQCHARKPLVSPARERAALKRLLADVG